MKFEYKVIKNVAATDVEVILNEAGKDGWDCFELDKDYELNGVVYYTIFLKKVIEDEKITLFQQYIDTYEPEWLKQAKDKYTATYESVTTASSDKSKTVKAWSDK